VATIRVGVSGWRYAPWRGPFYPPGLPQRAELAYASRRLTAIEINGSFYSLQRPEHYALWHGETPDGFVFAVKGGRYITHMLKLREIEQPLANFFASGLFNLREKLGPILWQFPPKLRFARERFEPFLRLLPQDTRAAGALARKRSAWMKGRVRLATGPERPLRHAIEVRDESFLVPAFLDLLREHGVALVTTEAARHWRMVADLTADFVYLRLHGDRKLYRSGYSERAITRWADRIRAWNTGSEPDDLEKVEPAVAAPPRPRDVYCFFDNTDEKLRAPVDARTLMHQLGLSALGGAADAHPRRRGTREIRLETTR
jgi:uncharacterized protein YecE (DUF72 family)